MKKRLLITSIVMMLVVAVALSTATYAWFTTSTNVSAQAVVLTASTMDGDAILISHYAHGNDKSSSIVLTSAQTGRLYPATPLAADSFADGVAATDFQSLIMTGTGTLSDPGVAAPNVKFYSDTFYVFNLGFQDTKLTPTINITYNSADNTSKMAAMSARVAILERVATAEVAKGSNVGYGSTYSLKGIWQFTGEGTDDAAITESYSYIRFDKVADNATYDSNASYYTGTGVAATDVESNFATLKSSGLYIGTEVTVNTTNGKVNVATQGGTALGSTTTASGYGAVETSQGSGVYTQNNIAFTPDANGFSGLGVAHSGMQIANEYTVVVWLEGWDADCTNAITSGTFKVDLSFAAARVA